MPYEKVHIATRDGTCPSHLVSPEGTGPWPAVIFYTDAGGIRPAQLAMCERLSAAGYVVLLPDLFYRYGPYGPLVPAEVFKGDFRAILGPLMATTSTTSAAEDTQAYLAFLDQSASVAKDRIGVVGFCMGGGMAIVSAATYPDRVAAVVSFHGGNLATDAPSSPHLFVSSLKAELYIAAAENDGSYPVAMSERFEASLTAAQVRFRTETYEAAHGWMVPDFPVFNRLAAERGWTEMLSLFKRTLRVL